MLFILAILRCIRQRSKRRKCANVIIFRRGLIIRTELTEKRRLKTMTKGRFRLDCLIALVSIQLQLRNQRMHT